VSEIDQPHHPEDHADPESGKSIEAANAYGVDENLCGLSHQGEIKPLIATPK
jgi:hypothetical protein